MNLIPMRLIIPLVIFFLFLSACSPEQEQEQSQASAPPPTTTTPTPSAATNLSTTADNTLDIKLVTIATGGASGPYNIIATALSELYHQNYDLNTKTQTTGASVENVNLLNQKKVEMAFLMSDVLDQSQKGVGAFSQKIDTIEQIAALYPNYVQIVTATRSGINSVADLAGKRVAVGDQNSGVEVNARTILQGHNLTYDDLSVDYLGYAAAADALKAGRIDAAFLTSGLPNAALLELMQGFDAQLVPIAAEIIKTIAQEQSYFVPMVIPRGTYNNNADIPTAAIMNALVIRKDISPEDGYKLTKTFFENLTLLENAHQAVKEISLKHAQEGLVAPLHPGAQQYYREQSP